MNNYIKLARPSHWVKNLFIFTPLFFSGQLGSITNDVKALATFFLFSFAASSIYVLNDIKDVDRDRNHPEKKNRPIASGAVPISSAWIFYFFLSSLALVPAIFFDLGYEYIAGYIVLNILYTFILKHIAIVDITCISIGFVLRVLIGGAVTGIAISKWLILMTFLLSIGLALGKRRSEVIIANNGAKAIRPSLAGYNLEFINLTLVFTVVTSLISYIMYSVSPEVMSQFNSDKLYLSSIFVFLGIMRFIQIAIVEQKSGSPTKILLKDAFIQIVLFLWILFFAVIIYTPWLQ